MRLLTLLTVLLVSSIAEAGVVGYGSIDLGGQVALPAAGGFREQYGLGGALEFGAIIHRVQLGGRLRITPFNPRGTAPGLIGATGLVLRWRFQVSERFALGAGLFGGVGVTNCWGDTGDGICLGKGVNLALDLRASWLLDGHRGLHLAFEPQLQLDVPGAARLFAPTLWVGFDW